MSPYQGTIFTQGPILYVSKLAPVFVIQVDFSIFSVEIIRGFKSTFGFFVYLSHTPLDFYKGARGHPWTNLNTM